MRFHIFTSKKGLIQKQEWIPAKNKEAAAKKSKIAKSDFSNYSGSRINPTNHKKAYVRRKFFWQNWF